MKKVTEVVLHKADEILDLGFRDDLELILEAASSDGSAEFLYELFLKTRKPTPISDLHRDEG
jgi:superfamily II DNA/RNA helicase